MAGKILDPLFQIIPYLFKDMNSTNKRRSSYKDIVYADGTKGILRTDSQPGFSLLELSDDELSEQKSPVKCTCFHENLDSCYDILCDNDFYQVSLLEVSTLKRIYSDSLSCILVIFLVNASLFVFLQLFSRLCNFTTLL